MKSFAGIGGAGVVAMYKLANPKYSDSPSTRMSAAGGHGGSQGGNAGGPKFESDAIFEEIKARAGQVTFSISLFIYRPLVRECFETPLSCLGCARFPWTKVILNLITC